MNNEWKKRLDGLMEKHIAEEQIVGGTLLFIKDGKEAFRGNYGMADKANNVPIKDDTIFRLYSMTKPITATALMILYDRGKIDLYDDVCRYLDGFKNQKVATENGLVDVKRNVRIMDLLTMTSGLMYPDRGVNAAGDAMADLFDRYYADTAAGHSYSTLEICNKIGQVPLMAQPGDCWNYGTSADVIAGVIEVVSGKKYSEFLKEEIFAPLGMNDTSFWVPPEKYSRLAEIYIRDEKNKLVPCEWQHLGLTYKYTKPPEFEIGGAGLVSTADDYAKFAQMLLNNGEYQGKRIVSKNAISLITADRLTESQKRTYGWDSCVGYGYGGLMRVLTDKFVAGAGELGEYGWDGWTGNYFCNDPVNNISMIYMIQTCGGSGPRPLRLLKQAFYASLDE